MPITFTKVSLPYGWLGNMSPYPRSATDLKLMRFVLGLKLKQYPDLQAKLLETAPQEIIEDETKRAREPNPFWGQRWNEEIKTWIGQNALGELWMDWRTDLRCGKGVFLGSWCPKDTNDDGDCCVKHCPWCGELR